MDAVEILHQKALGAVKEYKRSESELIEILMEVESRKVFSAMGFSSLFQYCVKALGISEDRAWNFISVSRKCREVPQLKVAIDQGSVSMTNARRVSGVMSSENQAEWISKASNLSLRDLEKEIVKAKPEAVVKEKLKAVTETKSEFRCSVSHSLDEKIRRVQELVSKKKQKPCSLEEALGVLVEFYLEKNDPLKKAERASEKRSVQAAPTKPSMKAGRRTEIPRAVAHQVNLRDRGRCQCRLPTGDLCGDSRWVHLHHKKPVEMGGLHSVENLVSLCAGHHRISHSH